MYTLWSFLISQGFRRQCTGDDSKVFLLTLTPSCNNSVITSLMFLFLHTQHEVTVRRTRTCMCILKSVIVRRCLHVCGTCSILLLTSLPPSSPSFLLCSPNACRVTPTRALIQSAPVMDGDGWPPNLVTKNYYHLNYILIYIFLKDLIYNNSSIVCRATKPLQKVQAFIINDHMMV